MTCVYTSQWRLRTRRIGASQADNQILPILKGQSDDLNLTYSVK